MNSLCSTSSQDIEYVRLKWVLQAIESGRREASDTDGSEDGVLSIGGEHVGWGGEWIFENPRYISRDFFNSMSSGVIRANDVLLVKDGATIGKAAIAERMPSNEAAVNEHVFLLRISDDNFPKYYFYVIQSPSVQEQIWLEVRGAAQPGLSSEFCSKLIVPRPSKRVQVPIANYLDRETARLDALVAEKERLLKLLAEKRRALITRAVTRGLDPNVPLRDSGVLWLGEIPAHWETWKVGHLAEVGNGSTPSRNNAAYWSEGTIPWLNSSVVNYSEVTRADQFVTALATQECHLPQVKRGSVLVAITGQGKTRGRAAVLSFDATINQHLAFIYPKQSHLLPWFLKWTLFAAYDFLRSISDDAGGTKGALTCEAVANLRVPVPPVREQAGILENIATSVEQLDSLRAVAKNTISLIKERRSAIISAAITDQLEVT